MGREEKPYIYHLLVFFFVKNVLDILLFKTKKWAIIKDDSFHL